MSTGLIIILCILSIILILLTFIVYKRRKKSKLIIEDIPELYHVDWVAREAYLRGTDGKEYMYDFKDTSISMTIDNKYKITSSPTAQTIYITNIIGGKIIYKKETHI